MTDTSLSEQMIEQADKMNTVTPIRPETVQQWLYYFAGQAAVLESTIKQLKQQETTDAR